MPRFPAVIRLVLGFALAAGAWSLLRSRESLDDLSQAESELGTPDDVTTPGAGGLAVGGPSTGMREERSTGRRGGAVVGVVRRLGSPVAARVEVRWAGSSDRFSRGSIAEQVLTTAARLRPGRRPEGEAMAGSDGRFEIAGIAPGYVDVFAVAQDGARGVVSAQVAAEGARVTVDVRLTIPAPPLQGRAVHADGRPFNGLVVVMPPTIAHQPTEDEAVHTDALGRFTVTNLAIGPHVTRFVMPGEFLSQVLEPTLPFSGEWLVVVDGVSLALEGRVVDDATGAPIAGASVTANSSTYTRFLSALTRTDADGRFSVRHQGVTSVSIVADGYAVLSFAKLPSPPVEARLRRAAMVSGTVRRATDGTPVAGATVRIIELESANGFRPLGEVVSGPDGRYVQGGLPPSDVAVFADAPGLAMVLTSNPERSGLQTAATLHPGERTEIDISLVAAGAIAGRVLDSAGGAVADAVIGISTIEGRHPSLVDPAFPSRLWSVAADGSFLADGLPPDLRVSLSASTPDGRTAQSGWQMPGVSSVAPIEIRLPAARAVVVTVVDARDGRPIADADVSVGGWQPRAWTDEAGHATILAGAHAEKLTVSAMAPGFAQAQQTIDATQAAVELRLGISVKLSGRVEKADGSPVSGAYVTAFTVGGGLHAFGYTKDDGSFVIEGVGATELDVRADVVLDDGTRWSGEVKAKSGETAVIRLEAGQHGDRTHRAGGRSRNLVVRASDPAGRRVDAALSRIRQGASTSTGAIRDGEWTFPRSTEDRVTVEVWDARDEYGRSLGLAPGRAEAGPDQAELVVPLSIGATVDGTVFGTDGTPARGIVVVAAHPGQSEAVMRAALPEGELSRARTDADGRFRLVGLPPDAELRLIVRAPVGHAPKLPIPVRSGAVGVEIRLSVGMRPLVRVVDAAGAPVMGVVVNVVTLRNGTPWIGEGRTTDHAGTIRTAPLDPNATYRLEIKVGDRKDVGPVWIDAWKPHDDTIRLPRAYAIEGRVVDTAGKPLPRASVHMSVPGSTDSPIGVSLTGQASFRLEGAIEGSTTLRVEATGFVSRDVTVEVRSSTSPVTIVLDTGLEWRVRIDGWSQQARRSLIAFDETLSPTTGSTVQGAIASDGSVKFQGIDPKRSYTLWQKPSVGEDLYVLARGVRWTDGETHVGMTRGGSIRGRASLPPGSKDVLASARSGRLWLVTPVAADGEFELRGVPPGRFSLDVTTTVEGEVWRATAEAGAGDNVSMTLKRAE